MAHARHVGRGRVHDWVDLLMSECDDNTQKLYSSTSYEDRLGRS